MKLPSNTYTGIFNL